MDRASSAADSGIPLPAANTGSASVGAAPNWASQPSQLEPTAKPRPKRNAELRSRNTYYEFKVTTEEWWAILFAVWIGVSLVLITHAIMYNVTTGWHCPKNCNAFLTPFAVSIATCAVPVFVCCPVFGCKGVWWVHLKRKRDDDQHRSHHRRTKKLCCFAISYIPRQYQRGMNTPADQANELPEWVKPGTSHMMATNPGDPTVVDEHGNRKKLNSVQQTEKLNNIRAAGRFKDSEQLSRPEEDEIKRQEGLRGPQTKYDVAQEVAPPPLTSQGAYENSGISARGRPRGNTIELRNSIQTVPINPLHLPATKVPGAARFGGVQSGTTGPRGTYNADQLSDLMEVIPGAPYQPLAHSVAPPPPPPSTLLPPTSGSADRGMQPAPQAVTGFEQPVRQRLNLQPTPSPAQFSAPPLPAHLSSISSISSMGTAASQLKIRYQKKLQATRAEQARGGPGGQMHM